jgi:signal transduction histidine kinase
LLALESDLAYKWVASFDVLLTFDTGPRIPIWEGSVLRVNAICDVTAKQQNADSSVTGETNESIRILLVGQSASANEWVSQSLKKEFPSNMCVGTASHAEWETKLSRDKYDVLLYQAVPDASDARHALETVRVLSPQLRLIVVVEPGFEKLAAEMVRHGAADYVIKTIHYLELIPCAVRKALCTEQTGITSWEAVDMSRRDRQHWEHLVARYTTQIRELDRQRVEIAQLAATGWLSAQIAHEINNPLAGIKNAFLLLKDGISPEHRYYEYVGLIEKELERISRVVHQMYDLYRPDRAVPREFSVKALCEDVAALLEPSSRQCRVPIVIEPMDPAIRIKAPEACLSQVLISIIQNAIEASAPNHEVRVSVIATDADCCIIVTDQGCGISEDIRDYVFQPFFTTKQGARHGNLGLGLAVSQKLMQSIQGTLVYESRVGLGTTFRIRLPRD